MEQGQCLPSRIGGQHGAAPANEGSHTLWCQLIGDEQHIGGRCRGVPCHHDSIEFSEVDMLIFLPTASGGSTTIEFNDFVNNFPVIRLTEASDTFVA